MAAVVQFTFNPFQENTFIVYDDTRECIIIDPGCYTAAERKELSDYINKEGLSPVKLLNTHAHIDHIFGNRFVYDSYGLLPEMHAGEVPVLESAPQVSAFFGVSYPDPSPAPEHLIEAGEIISFGNTQLLSLYTPGHSPASLSFFCEADRFVLAGDVLFYGSIGRTDLPGGNYNTLINNITTVLMPLGDDVQVYSGHGPATSIGYERRHNPFL